MIGFDPVIELDEAEFQLYSVDHNRQPSHDFECLSHKLQQLSLNLYSLSLGPVCPRAFDTVESHMWGGFEHLRNQHGHTPFHARDTRRNILKDRVSNSHLEIPISNRQGLAQTHVLADRAPSIRSSSDASSTTRSTDSSPINRVDDNTDTSYTNTQGLADHMDSFLREEHDPQGLGKSSGYGDDSDKKNSPVDPPSMYLCDQDQSAAHIPNIPRPGAELLVPDQSTDAYQQPCTLCNGTGRIAQNVWQRIMTHSQPAQHVFTGTANMDGYYTSIPTCVGYMPGFDINFGNIGQDSSQGFDYDPNWDGSGL